MPNYEVTTYEEEMHRYTYRLEANSAEEAEEKVRAGEVKPEHSKCTGAEIVRVEIGELK